MRRSRYLNLVAFLVSPVVIVCYGQVTVAIASTVKGKVVEADETAGTETWEWEVTAGEGELIRDFHVCVGQKDSQQDLTDAVGDVEFPLKPTNWLASVTAIDAVNVYLNFYASTGGVSIGPSDGVVKFRSKVKKNKLKKGKATAVFTSDGNEDAADGRLPEEDENKNPKPTDGPVLSVSSGRCELGGGVCATSTEEACTLLGGVFELGGECSTGACCRSGQCEDLSRPDCEDADFGVFQGDGTACLGNNNGNGLDDACEEPIPTASEWGLIVMTLVMLTAGTIVIGRSRRRFQKGAIV